MPPQLKFASAGPAICLRIKTACTCHLHLRKVLSIGPCTFYMWYVHVPYTCYMWFVHVPYTCYMWSVTCDMAAKVSAYLARKKSDTDNMEVAQKWAEMEDFYNRK